MGESWNKKNIRRAGFTYIEVVKSPTFNFDFTVIHIPKITWDDIMSKFPFILKAYKKILLVFHILKRLNIDMFFLQKKYIISLSKLLKISIFTISY